MNVWSKEPPGTSRGLGSGVYGRKGAGIRIVDDEPVVKKQGGCCSYA